MKCHQDITERTLTDEGGEKTIKRDIVLLAHTPSMYTESQISYTNVYLFRYNFSFGFGNLCSFASHIFWCSLAFLSLLELRLMMMGYRSTPGIEKNWDENWFCTHMSCLTCRVCSQGLKLLIQNVSWGLFTGWKECFFMGSAAVIVLHLVLVQQVDKRVKRVSHFPLSCLQRQSSSPHMENLKCEIWNSFF